MYWLLVLFLVGCASESGPPAPEYGADVDARVLAHVRAYGPQHILLVGDSLTDQSPLTSLCGLPVVRAGYSGGKWQAVAERPSWAQIHSAIVVIQLGTNNALKGPGLSVEAMEPFLAVLASHSDRLLVVTIPPFFNIAYLTPDAVQRTAEIQSAQLATPYQHLDMRDEMGRPELYLDGIHWNAAGYQAANALLQQALCPM